MILQTYVQTLQTSACVATKNFRSQCRSGSDFTDLVSDFADSCSDFADLSLDFADFDLRGDYEFSLPTLNNSDLLSLNIKP